jgi:hypothetical protein
VMAAALVLRSSLAGALRPRTPWLWAVAIGVWMPAVNIVQTQNYGSLAALAFSFMGAYAGMCMRRALAQSTTGSNC